MVGWSKSHVRTLNSNPKLEFPSPLPVFALLLSIKLPSTRSCYTDSFTLVLSWFCLCYTLHFCFLSLAIPLFYPAPFDDERAHGHELTSLSTPSFAYHQVSLLSHLGTWYRSQLARCSLPSYDLLEADSVEIVHHFRLPTHQPRDLQMLPATTRNASADAPLVEIMTTL